MSKRVQLDREQLKRLDEESLVELILVLQQQMAAQQELIQKLQDPTGERQSQQRQAAQQRWSEERQTKESAPLWPAAAWGATWAQGAHLDAGGGTGPCHPS